MAEICTRDTENPFAANIDGSLTGDVVQKRPWIKSTIRISVFAVIGENFQ